jgi:Caspase domain/Domain of unknown function (DUF4384)
MNVIRRLLILATFVATIGVQMLPAAAAARTVQILAPGNGTVRALVIGIDRYTSVNQLKGAAADARDMEQTLRGAGVKDLTALIDENATRSNVDAAMNHLIESSKAGDLVIISFAGHGTQEPEHVKGSETDGMDEVFLLTKFAKSGTGTGERIIDDEINAWLQRLQKKNADVIFVADTCHGGGMLRAADLRAGELSYRQTPPLLSLTGDVLKPISTDADARLTANDLPNVTFLAAVDKFSKAPEVKIQGYSTLRGALSYAVARAIDGGDDGAVTRAQLFGSSRQIAYQYSETKQTIATEPIGQLDKVIFRLKVSGDADAAAQGDAIRIRIINGAAGVFSGVVPGQFRYRIVGDGEDADLTWDVSKGDVINGVGGDVITKCTDASGMPAIVDGVAALFAVKKLAEKNPQIMKLLPNDARFHEGDRVRFHIEGVAGKYLILVNLSGNGEVQYLFPREKSDPVPIVEDSYDLTLQVSEPFGSDHLIALVSNQRANATESAISSLHQQKSAGKLAKAIGSASALDRNLRIGFSAVFTEK